MNTIYNPMTNLKEMNYKTQNIKLWFIKVSNSKKS